MKKEKVIYITVFLIFVLCFGILKYIGEKKYDDILYIGTNEYGVNYLSRSQIKKGNLYIDYTGPVVKESYYILNDNYIKNNFNITIRDKKGLILAKQKVNPDNIDMRTNEHIILNAVIPSISWFDRLKGLDIKLNIPEILMDNTYVNDDVSYLCSISNKPIEEYGTWRGQFGDITPEQATNIIKALKKKNLPNDDCATARIQASYYPNGINLMPHLYCSGSDIQLCIDDGYCLTTYQITKKFKNENLPFYKVNKLYFSTPKSFNR